MKRTSQGELSVNEQLALLQSQIQDERTQQVFDDDLLYLHHWIRIFWTKIQRTNGPDMTTPLVNTISSWCKSSHPDQNSDSPQIKCQFVSCFLPSVVEDLRKGGFKFSLSIKDCYYCPSHNLLHVCSDKNNFSTKLFLDTQEGIQKPNDLRFTSFRQGLQDGKKIGTLVFGTCKYHMVKPNDQSDYEHQCIISRKTLSTQMLQIWEQLVDRPSHVLLVDDTTTNKVPTHLRDYVKTKIASELPTQIPKPLSAKSSGLTKNTDSNQSIILSKKILESIERAANPLEYIQQMLAKLQPSTGSKQRAQGGNVTYLSLLAKYLPNQRRKILDKRHCYQEVFQILRDFFYSSMRTQRYHNIIQKKGITAVKDLRQYYHQKIYEEREMPIAVRGLVIFCSALTISSSQGPALQEDRNFMNEVASQVYRQWIIVCFSPYSLGGTSTIDFTSIVLAVIFSMRHGKALGNTAYHSQQQLHQRIPMFTKCFGRL